MSDEQQGPQPPKRKGRPRYHPTEKERKQVRTMAGLGIPQEQIALVIGLSEPTLRKYFRHEIKVGAIEANTQVAASLWRQATHPEKPNAIVGIYWTKARMGWRDHDPAQAQGKKEQQAEEAARAAEGKRFAPGSAPPPLRVVK
jgi:DNA-binding CsgD family transcriptional regulator